MRLTDNWCVRWLSRRRRGATVARLPCRATRARTAASRSWWQVSVARLRGAGRSGGWRLGIRLGIRVDGSRSRVTVLHDEERSGCVVQWLVFVEMDVVDKKKGVALTMSEGGG